MATPKDLSDFRKARQLALFLLPLFLLLNYAYIVKVLSVHGSQTMNLPTAALAFGSPAGVSIGLWMAARTVLNSLEKALESLVKT